MIGTGRTESGYFREPPHRCKAVYPSVIRITRARIARSGSSAVRVCPLIAGGVYNTQLLMVKAPRALFRSAGFYFQTGLIPANV